MNPLLNHQTETESRSNEVVILSRGKYFIRRCRYYYQIPWRCLYIQGLVITNSLSELAAVSILITYLTEARNEKLINAAATVNILEVLSGILSVPASILKDYLGCHPMVFLTTQVYIMGMVFLCISASIRNSHTNLKNPSYMFETLFLYVGLFVIVLGKAGSNSSCVEEFFGEQLKKNASNNGIDEKRNRSRQTFWMRGSQLLGVVMGMNASNNDIDKRNRARQMFWMHASQLLGVILGIVLLAKVDAWKVRYAVCAIMMQLALTVFIISFPYKCLKRTATTTTNTPPHPPPNDVNEQEIERLQRNDEVKENTKILRLLVPISVTFLIYGIVTSIGSTFFLEQGTNMKGNKISPTLIPTTTLLIIVSYFSKTLLNICMKRLLRNRLTGLRNIYATLIIIGVGLIFSIICCATAQAVEAKRLGIIVKNPLLLTDDSTIPMSVYWLLPQFIFLGATEGLVGDGMESFFESELPMCMRIYASEVTEAVTGIGTLVSLGLVSIAAKASTIGGGTSWFADIVNRSQLDRFYRSLTILCLMFCFAYAYVSTAYMHKRLPRNEEEDYEGLAQAGIYLEITKM